MTDEEKAEKYVDNAIKGYEKDFTECEVFSMITCYKDGLAEGRKEIEQLRKEKDVITKVYNRQCSVVIELNAQLKSLKIVSQGLEKEIEELEKENAGLKKNLERYSQEIAEQEETIDAQDDKINFYVSKMNENILKRQELEKENAELKVREQALGERVLQLEKDKGKLNDENKKLRCCGNCKHCVFKYDDEDLIFECDITGTESCTHLKICDKWELAE